MTRLTRMKVFLAVALVGLVTANAQAAVISVQPVVVGFFDTDFNPIPPLVPFSGYPNGPVVVKVDVMMQVLSLLPGEDSFGFADFSFESVPLPIRSTGCRCIIVPDPDAGGWAPNIFNVDSNGGIPGGIVPIFATNGDLGPSSQDLQGIRVQMATGAFTNAADPRRNVGEAGSPLGVPIRLGSAFLEWNSKGEGTFILNPIQVAIKLTNGDFLNAQAVEVIPTIVLGNHLFCPEPSSLVLLGSCLMGVVLHRRV